VIGVLDWIWAIFGALGRNALDAFGRTDDELWEAPILRRELGHEPHGDQSTQHRAQEHHADAPLAEGPRAPDFSYGPHRGPLEPAPAQCKTGPP
jgi:hypothetical protein